MARIRFVDRTGESQLLESLEGERLCDLLTRNSIPPASVVITEDGDATHDLVVPNSGRTYEVRLIEGYNLAAIRDLYDRLRPSSLSSADYVKQRLTPASDGSLTAEAIPMSAGEVADLVESTVLETCEEFALLEPDSRVLVGLSGGVDSTSLLLALASLRERWPALEIVAVTFEDFDMLSGSPTLAQAEKTASRASVEHVVAPSGLASEVFNLNLPLHEAMQALMTTPQRHQVMYIDSHTTRRVLEVVAADRGIDRIALGLHTTDLVAGLLNGFMTGYPSGPLPMRPIGDLNFIYPLALVAKRELHTYFSERTGRVANHASPNEWELDPLDRNFYYYVADQLQSVWPGMELMLLAANEHSSRSGAVLGYGECVNCEGTYAHLPMTSVTSEHCDVCRIFGDHGFLEES